MILYNPTVSGSLLVTGSLTTTGTLTAQTLVVQTVTSSVDFVTGSSVNGSLSSNTHQFTGSVLITGSATTLLSVNNSVLFVSASGNVGIGTNTPRISASGTNKTLDVKGGIYFGDTNSESCTINNDDSMIFNIDANNSSTSNFFRFATNTTQETGGTELMRLTEAGLLGIGTSSPDYALTISGSTEAASGIRIKNTNGTTSAPRLIIEQANAQKMQMYAFTDSFVFNYNLTGGVAFYDGVANANRFYISGSGNVGIGTSSPTTLLHLSSSYNGGGTGMLHITSNGTEGGTITFEKTSGTTQKYKFGLGTNQLFVYNETAGNQPFTITSGGVSHLGDGFNSSNHRINRKVSQGNAVLVVSAFDSVGNDTAIFYAVNGVSGNAAGTALMMPRNDSTNRSINAGGTVNASGADYAEYMTKSINDIINKGDIVGVDINGKLTNIFADSISFVVKSTDPSYVGGDVWGNEDIIGKKPLQTEDQSEEEFAIINEVFEAKLEEERAKVDRISFSGQVPCNVLGANVGDYIIPIQTEDGKITGQAITSPSFEQYQLSVGKVWKIMEDGRAWIAVKIG